ncbi:hypothetical protein DH2020_012443 [Rehmannia glutinosa]|uniref:Uncharacterized protein n=1 Tax=Rehmannia glutinosa TaxID=99300 RepID=A0ABR0X2F8_REHGL
MTELMKEEEKQRKFHEALLKVHYPPRQPLNDLPGEQLENEEGYSMPSSSDDEGENGGTEKLTRAQRKRLRKRKLKEAASRRRKIIGPLLPPGSSDDKNDGGVEVVDNVPEGVRQNAATDVSSGEPASCSKGNKRKQRRKSKNLSGKS